MNTFKCPRLMGLYMSGGAPNGEIGRVVAHPTRSGIRAMATTNSAGKTGTDDESDTKTAYIRSEGALVPVGEVEVGR